MNNILLSKLPQSVNIAGAEVEINSDFRQSILFEGLFNKYNLEDEEEQRKFYNEGLKLYYPILNINFDNSKDEIKLLLNHVVDNISEAVEQMLYFYRCGKDLKEGKNTKSKNIEIYSYEHDSDKIYSAFLDQYKLDLQEVDYLHWWKFKALFGALKEDNEISKIMNIRAIDISKLPKEQKEHYKKLKKIYEIPKDDEEVAENNALEEALLKGEDISKFL